MAALSITVKEEPKDDADLPSQTGNEEPSGLDYNAIYGNMYRDFLANNVGTSCEPTRPTSPPKNGDSNKTAIPPECFAENLDIQDVVNEFKVTLEKFGVSQRFAAKYIMEDTSQGNLSFLMDKGKRLRWSELSPKGRIPYVKMKQWLDSKQKQINTIEMVKESKALTRQNASRDAFQRRERFSLFQLTVLCRLFEENANPSMTTRAAIAEKLSIPPERINVWFQNQRARGFPAKRILQQSFHAASSTNGAARSASIMDSVAMEIVNQSKSDSFLANDSALVNQYVENSLGKNEADDNDVHKLLLQYQTETFQQNFSKSSGREKSDAALLLENVDKTGNDNKSTEDRVCANIKTEVEQSSPLDEINREMTADEKVNGYLNHLSRSRSKTACGGQIDSVVKRITKTQSGAAKRKPAFLNKVLTQTQGNVSTPDKYSSPYPNPLVTQSSMLYDSSPLSALYRQTASVNFTPPNPSFNYLFDIGSPAHLANRGTDGYSRRSGTFGIVGSESVKRPCSEVLGDMCLDLKRHKGESLARSDMDEADKRDSKKDSVVTESSDKCSKEIEHDKKENSSFKDNRNSTVKDNTKLSVSLEGSNGDNTDREINDTNKDKLALNATLHINPERTCPPNKQSKDTNEIKVDECETRLDTLSTRSSEHGTEISGADVKSTHLDNDSAVRSNDNDYSGASLEREESYLSEKNNLHVSNNESDIDKKYFKEHQKDTKNENTTDSETLKNYPGHDIDKPLSKDEMNLFKSLYARFVKYHFAQMQFPEIK